MCLAFSFSVLENKLTARQSVWFSPSATISGSVPCTIFHKTRAKGTLVKSRDKLMHGVLPLFA